MAKQTKTKGKARCPVCRIPIGKGGARFLHMKAKHPKHLKKYYPDYTPYSKSKKKISKNGKSDDNVSFVHMKFCCHCGEELPNAIAK